VLRFTRAAQELSLSLDESAHLNAPSAFGAYRVLHQIGSGVLGPVFRTYEPQHDRLVAVKAFRLELVPEDVERFADALRRLVDARVAHPGIVPALDAGLQSGMAYLAMEYIAGETLDVAFRHLAPAPLGRALQILSTMAGAIDASWAAGIGHGALHPRDVFFRAGSDEVSLTGFGVVPALEAVGLKPQARRPYAAPERAAGGPATLAADIYSLGAIAHELLTRRRPSAPGEQDGSLATSVSPQNQQTLGRILSAALASEPEDRFATAQAFVSALETINDRAPAMAPTAGPLFDQITDERPQSHRQPNADLDPDFDTMAMRRRDLLAASDLQLTPVHVQPNWEASLERTPMPEPVPEPPALEPAVPDLKLEQQPERPSARGKDWDLRAAADDQPQQSAEVANVARDRRPLPPAMFASIGAEVPAQAPYPWAAIVAVALAALTVGGVGGYLLGARARGPSVTSAPPPSPGPTVVTPPPAPPPVAGDSAGTPATAGAADPAAKPAAPPAPVTGRVTVQSIPAGALITFDGKSRGSAPQTFADLPLGKYTLKVARSGYVPKTQDVVLTAEEPSRDVTVRLERPGAAGRAGSASSAAARTGILVVDTLPKGASVTIDGKPAGVTPVRVPALAIGTHTVRIQLAGHKPVVTTVTIKAGENKLTRSLERNGG
jgi:serine/threonine protein kinase